MLKRVQHDMAVDIRNAIVSKTRKGLNVLTTYRLIDSLNIGLSGRLHASPSPQRGEAKLSPNGELKILHHR